MYVFLNGFDLNAALSCYDRYCRSGLNLSAAAIASTVVAVVRRRCRDGPDARVDGGGASVDTAWSSTRQWPVRLHSHRRHRVSHRISA